MIVLFHMNRLKTHILDTKPASDKGWDACEEMVLGIIRIIKSLSPSSFTLDSLYDDPIAQKHGPDMHQSVRSLHSIPCALSFTEGRSKAIPSITNSYSTLAFADFIFHCTE